MKIQTNLDFGCLVLGHFTQAQIVLHKIKKLKKAQKTVLAIKIFSKTGTPKNPDFRRFGCPVYGLKLYLYLFFRKLLNIFLCLSQLLSNSVYALFIVQNMKPVCHIKFTFNLTKFNTSRCLEKSSFYNSILHSSTYTVQH